MIAFGLVVLTTCVFAFLSLGRNLYKSYLQVPDSGERTSTLSFFEANLDCLFRGRAKVSYV